MGQTYVLQRRITLRFLLLNPDFTGCGGHDPPAHLNDPVTGRHLMIGMECRSSHFERPAAFDVMARPDRDRVPATLL